MAYRGFDSKVVVGFDGVLDDEVCRDCGICVDYCPTSALSWVGDERKDPGKKSSLDPMYADESEKRVMLLSLLQERQRRDQYTSEVAIKEIAETMKLSVSDVYGVATFYSFLSVKPQGRNVIRVCKNLPCYLRGGAMIAASVEKTIGIGPGGTTEDRRFSFELTNCIGACDLAPAMLINDDVHGNLTPEVIPEILEAYT
jgi:NADH:ubiquinone oxidoreductase subunit E